MGCGYEYVIFIFVLVPFQYQTTSSYRDFWTCSSFIHFSLEIFFIKLPSYICYGSLYMVVTPFEVGINILGIWISTFYLVFIQGLIDCFIVPFNWHGDLTNILFIQEFSLLLLWLYHIYCLVNKISLFLFICIVIYALRCQAWGEEYCFNMIDVLNLFWCKNSSWEIWEYPIQS